MSKAKFVGVFGRRNSGKSSLINTLSGEQVAIVSETPGTTTDPVKKRMEIFGVGPCVFIDTAGIDDEGDLGEQRIAKTRQVILQIDLAILLYTNNEIGSFELELLERFKENNIPVIIVHNQSDIISMDKELALEISAKHGFDVLEFSSGM
ncbi:MAG: mnmE, partial [Bacteroidetes bacterium]|nr:mnmE [Bacteroidota bacterium]